MCQVLCVLTMDDVGKKERYNHSTALTVSSLDVLWNPPTVTAFYQASTTGEEGSMVLSIDSF